MVVQRGAWRTAGRDQLVEARSMEAIAPQQLARSAGQRRLCVESLGQAGSGAKTEAASHSCVADMRAEQSSRSACIALTFRLPSNCCTLACALVQRGRPSAHFLRPAVVMDTL